MDPDIALATALTSPDPDERVEAVYALRGWLLRGGFPPKESIIREAGVDRRMPLKCPHGGMFLEKYRDGWAVVVGLGSERDNVNAYYRLRRD